LSGSININLHTKKLQVTICKSDSLLLIHPGLTFPPANNSNFQNNLILYYRTLSYHVPIQLNKSKFSEKNPYIFKIIKTKAACRISL